MPKLKTHKGAAKRFKKTGTGKVKRNKAFLRHILTSKAKKRKKQLGTATLVSDADEAKVKQNDPVLGFRFVMPSCPSWSANVLTTKDTNGSAK